MSLTDDFKTDIDNVFLDNTEFGETLNITFFGESEKTYNVIVFDEIISINQNDNEDIIFDGYLFLKTDDLPNTTPGATFTLDSKNYVVIRFEKNRTFPGTNLFYQRTS